MTTKTELVFHGTCCLFLIVGLYDVFFNYEENMCEMSYMWELPQYQQIPLTKDVTDKYPRYGLYIYGEGIYFEVISDLKLEGIPVLFIPGNGGSKNQARSVASILLRKSQNINWTSHFNVFTVDLNEELVAFYGSTLNDQVEFVAQCIMSILKLYEESNYVQTKPTSVILIGHSMGGMIAKGVIASPGFTSDFISTIITLATPHVHPIINLDEKISYFYRTVNSYWKNHCQKLKNVTVVSVSGGDRDFQVNGGVARLRYCANNTLATSSTAVPRAWVSADHQCAAWCKQVILATTRALFDMVDSRRNQISDDRDLRWKSINYHFSHHPGFSSFSHTLKSQFKPLNSHVFKYINNSRWSLSKEDDFEKATYFVFSLKDMQAKGMTLLIAKTTIDKDRWISLTSEKSFKSITDISNRAILTPKCKVLRLNLDELVSDDYTYILVNVPKYAKNVEDYDVNFLRPKDYVINVTVPHIFSNLWTLNYGYDLDHTIGKTPGQFYYRIYLNGLHSIFHAYKVGMKAIVESRTSPLLQLQLPSTTGFSYGQNGSIIIKLQSTNGYEHPVLHLFTDGYSEYTGNIKVQFMQLLGQIIKYDGACLPTMIAINIMLAYSYQLKLMLFGIPCPTLSDAHKISAKPYKIQPFVNVVKAMYSYDLFSKYWNSIGLPIPDAVLLDQHHNTWFALLPLVLFLFAYEMLSLMVFLHDKLLAAVCAIECRILKKTKYSNNFFASFIFHTIVMSLSAFFSGALTLFYICILSFFDLCYLKNCLSREIPAAIVANGEHEDNSTKNENQQKYSDQIHAEYNIKTSMHFMWVCLAALSFPSGIAWFKGYNSASSDPLFALAIFGSLLYLVHRLQTVSLVPNTLTRILCKMLYPLTIFTSIVCLHSLFRLPYCILGFLSLHVFIQLFG